MGVRAVAFLAGMSLVGLVAGFVFIGGPKPVPRPMGVPQNAPYIDGLVDQIGVTKVVIKPTNGGREVPLVITLQHAGLVDVPHLVNFHQARNEPVRVFYERRGPRRIALGDVDLPGGPVPVARLSG